MTALEVPTTYFDRTTAVVPRPDAPGVHDASCAEGWESLRGVHGGFLAALVVRAVEQEEPQRVPRTLSMAFLRPAAVGPMEIEVRPVRRGAAVSTLAVELRQGTRSLATARVTAVRPVRSADWDTGEPLGLPPVEACVPLLPPPGVRHFEQAEGRLDPAAIPFTEGPAARVGGWVRPLESRPVDAAWLAMALDWFPPSPFTRHAAPVGGVSVDYTVHLHAVGHARDLGPDDGGWLGARFESTRAADGLALEHGRLQSPDGALVAESFHTRWTYR